MPTDDATMIITVPNDVGHHHFTCIAGAVIPFHWNYVVQRREVRYVVDVVVSVGSRQPSGDRDPFGLLSELQRAASKEGEVIFPLV